MKLFAPHVADGYKPGHRPLYPKGTQLLYGNMTARADRLFLKSPSCSDLWDNRVVWVGIQGVMTEIKELWDESFFSKPKAQVIARYERRMRHYLGEGKIPSDGFAALHDLGYLPISVLALPEGSRVNMNVPFYTIYNTIPEFFWLVNYLETSMSAMLWKMVTNATISYEYRRTLEAWAERTGSPKDFVSVQAHDFSYRGVGGLEDGARSGFPHLCNFMGSDTMPAMDYAEDYYGADAEHEFLACSLTATEHSVATANILSNLQSSRVPGDDFQIARLEAERQFILRVLTETNSTGGVALVCDSFNFWGVLTDVLPNPAVYAAIMNRGKDETGLCKTVVRPDSGDPVEVICGVEVLTLGGRDAAFEKRQDVVFYKDGERVFRATRVVGKSYNKTWTELDALVGSDDEWRVLSAPLRLFNSAGFPSHFKHEEVAYFEVMKQCVAYLGERGIVVERVEIGNYDRGYRIEGHTLSPVEKGAVQLLWETFGGTVTDKGFRVLDEHIGLIYGDSITVKRTQEIMRRLAAKGFASCNVVLGIGSFTYQYNTRDTFGMAIKATCCQVNGELIELYKDPMTEGETAKKSAKGFLVVDRVDGNFVLRQEQPLLPEDLATGSGELKQMFCDGVLTNPTTLAEIRARLASA
jgi:nicotinamide phosphoribosyltransferase